MFDLSSFWNILFSSKCFSIYFISDIKGVFMRQEFLPFCKPSITKEDTEAVSKVLLSSWITTGVWNADFEKNLCEYTTAKYAVALTSATAGMHIVLKALNIGPGDEVITPSLTWVSTVNMIVLAGATPVFCRC